MSGTRETKIQTFTIPLKPISWNLLAAKNRWTYTKLSNEWKQATWAVVRNINPVVEPCEIHFMAHWKQRRRHDIDALYTKAVVDQLVTMKILEDDSLEYVTRVIVEGKTGQLQDELIVTLRPTPPTSSSTAPNLI